MQEERRFRRFDGGWVTHVLGNARQMDLNVYNWGRSDSLAPGKCSGPMIHDMHIIECCTEGRGVLAINGRSFQLEQGMCYVLCPRDVAVLTADTLKPKRDVWIGIRGLKVELYMSRLGISGEQPFFDSRAFSYLRVCIEQIIRAGQEAKEGMELQQAAYVHLMFAKLLRLAAEGGRKRSRVRYVNEAIQFIETHFAEPVEIAGLAKALGLERSHLFSVFKEATGYSPQEYLMRHRIKKACEFLENPYASVETIAFAVGYSPVNFSRTFRKLLGMTPSEYRKTIYQKEKGPGHR